MISFCTFFFLFFLLQLRFHPACRSSLTQPQKGFPSNDYNAREHTRTHTHAGKLKHTWVLTHTHAHKLNALGLPPAISVGFPLLLPRCRSGVEGRRERKGERARERERDPLFTTLPWKPQLLARLRGYTGCLPACAPEWRCADLEMVRSAPKRPPKRRTGRRRKSNGKRSCVCASRGSFSCESRGRNGKQLCVYEEGDKRQRGDGSAWSATEALRVRFYSVRNDTKRFSDGCTDVLLTRS